METKAREFLLVKKQEPSLRSDFDCLLINSDVAPEEKKILSSLGIGKEKIIHAIEYSAYEKIQAENKKLREVLSNIREYWNGTYTVSALGDFANYTVDVCSEALREVVE